MAIRKPKLLRSLVGRKLSKPKFARFPTAKQMLLKAIKNPQAKRFAKRGGIQRIAKELHNRPNEPITATLLPQEFKDMPEPVLAELVDAATFAMQIPVHGMENTVIDVGVGDWPPLYEFDTTGNYISEQGGRVGIGVEVGIFNPETDQLKDLFHTFIFDDLPDQETLERMIDDFVQRVCDSPAFAYLKDGDGYCNFLYNLVVVDYVT
jgi:hypothetical protein